MKEYIINEDQIEDEFTVTNGELIRCKDCRYFDHGENPSETWSACIAHIGRPFETWEDAFCAWAERKEE